MKTNIDCQSEMSVNVVYRNVTESFSVSEKTQAKDLIAKISAKFEINEFSLMMDKIFLLADNFMEKYLNTVFTLYNGVSDLLCLR